MSADKYLSNQRPIYPGPTLNRRVGQLPMRYRRGAQNEEQTLFERSIHLRRSRTRSRRLHCDTDTVGTPMAAAQTQLPDAPSAQLSASYPLTNWTR